MTAGPVTFAGAEHLAVTLARRAPDVRLVNPALSRASLAVEKSCAATAGTGQVAVQQMEG